MASGTCPGRHLLARGLLVRCLLDRDLLVRYLLVRGLLVHCLLVRGLSVSCMHRPVLEEFEIPVGSLARTYRNA